jgi:heme/copper-type cytochrome/quinol oxidase subunit 2
MKLRPTFARFVDTATLPRILLFGVVIVAIGGAISASSPAAAPGVGPAATAYVQKLTLTIVPGREPNLESVLESRGNIAVAPGIPVQLTVTNHTGEFHTFTIPALHVSALIYPARGKTARKSTFHFTAWAPGKYRWFCAFCRHGGKNHRETMAGAIYAIIDPAVFLGG